MHPKQQIAILEEVLALLEQKADLCNRGVLRQDEANQALTETNDRVRGVLPKESTAFRIYDRGEGEADGWTRVNPSGYVNERDCRKIEKRIEFVRRALNEIEPEFLRDHEREKTQFYFSPGDAYGPKKQAFGLMKKANMSLAIVDEYLDEQIFDYINSLEPALFIRLLTGKKKPIFQQLFKALKVQRPSLEARAFSDCHDRFIVIDDGREVWHVGASFNGFGDKATMMNKVTDDQEHARFLKDLSDWWHKGEDLSV